MATNVLERKLTVEIKPQTSVDIKSEEMLGLFQQREAPLHTIKCFQNVGQSKFLVSFSKEDDIKNFENWFEFGNGSEPYKGVKYSIERAVNIPQYNQQQGIRITIFGVPYEMDTKYVLSKINTYCIANKIIRCTYRDHPYMYNGVCFVYTKKVANPIPSNLNIQGCRLGVKYEGQPQPDRKCYVCQVEGHTARDCPTRPPPPISPIPADKEESGTFTIYNPKKKNPTQIAKSVSDLIQTIRRTSTPNLPNVNNQDSQSTPGWIPDEGEWDNVEESDYDKSKEEIAQRSGYDITASASKPKTKTPIEKRIAYQDTPLSSRSNSKDRKRDRDRSSLLEDHKKSKIACPETLESQQTTLTAEPSNSRKATHKKNK